MLLMLVPSIFSISPWLYLAAGLGNKKYRHKLDCAASQKTDRGRIFYSYFCFNPIKTLHIIPIIPLAPRARLRLGFNLCLPFMPALFAFVSHADNMPHLCGRVKPTMFRCMHNGEDWSKTKHNDRIWQTVDLLRFYRAANGFSSFRLVWPSWVASPCNSYTGIGYSHAPRPSQAQVFFMANRPLNFGFSFKQTGRAGILSRFAPRLTESTHEEPEAFNQKCRNTITCRCRRACPL